MVYDKTSILKAVCMVYHRTSIYHRAVRMVYNKTSILKAVYMVYHRTSIYHIELYVTVYTIEQASTIELNVWYTIEQASTIELYVTVYIP